MVRKVSIVVPAFNERERVEELLRRVAAAPLPGGLEREILVVDDGSTDGTAEVAGGVSGVTVIRQPQNGEVVGGHAPDHADDWPGAP